LTRNRNDVGQHADGGSGIPYCVLLAPWFLVELQREPKAFILAINSAEWSTRIGYLDFHFRIGKRPFLLKIFSLLEQQAHIQVVIAMYSLHYKNTVSMTRFPVERVKSTRSCDCCLSLPHSHRHFYCASFLTYYYHLTTFSMSSVAASYG
jgi:hypothetical protein